jgi:hypothetical protein
VSESLVDEGSEVSGSKESDEIGTVQKRIPAKEFIRALSREDDLDTIAARGAEDDPLRNDVEAWERLIQLPASRFRNLFEFVAIDWYRDEFRIPVFCDDAREFDLISLSSGAVVILYRVTAQSLRRHAHHGGAVESTRQARAQRNIHV